MTRRSYMHMLVEAMDTHQRATLRAKINRTRRRWIPFTINGRTQFHERAKAKAYIDSMVHP